MTDEHHKQHLLASAAALHEAPTKAARKRKKTAIQKSPEHGHAGPRAPPEAEEETVSIEMAGVILGTVDRPWSKSRIKRAMQRDSRFPQPTYDGFRLHFSPSKLRSYKAAYPTVDHYDPEAAS